MQAEHTRRIDSVNPYFAQMRYNSAQVDLVRYSRPRVSTKETPLWENSLSRVTSSPATAGADRSMSSILDTEAMPVAVVLDAALRHNIASFAAYLERHGVDLAPHVKTTMSPELFALQRDAGAWAATVANVPQARTVYSWGQKHLVIANEIADPASIAWVAEALDRDAETEIYFWVDSVEGVRLAAREHERVGAERPLSVVVELGYAGGRAGCRGVEAATEVAAAVGASSRLRLCGVAGFEGTITGPSLDERRAAVDGFLDTVSGAFERFSDEGRFELDRPLLTAGGSAFFDLVAAKFTAGDSPRRVVVRSGCYITHDCGVYDEISPLGGEGGVLRPAIEVWAPVLSVPEPGLALLGLGKRDASFDAGLPVPRKWRRGDGEVTAAPDGLELFELNDQHAYVRDEAGRLAVGDLVGVGISHPCTTFDKWREMHLVDDGYERLATISTCF
jgi:D-serine dehydratase